MTGVDTVWPPSAGLVVGLLGPVQAYRDAVELPLGGTKQRAVVALLALNVGRVVPVDQLAGTLWGDDVPAKAAGTLQVYASSLRRILGADPGAPIVVFRRPGYLLDVDPLTTDLGQFRALAKRAQALLAAPSAERSSQAAGLLQQALSLWRGDPLADLVGLGIATGVIAQLVNERLAALEQRIDLDLDLGRHEQLVGELQGLVADFPLRERLWARLMLAEYRCGLQGAALDSYRRARDTLAYQLGLDPGAELRELEQAILTQSRELDHRRIAASPDSQLKVTLVAGDRRSPPAWLVRASSERIPLTRRRTVLGRDDACEVVIPNAIASRRHALIRPAANGYDIVDLDSTNGTEVNGLELEAQVPHRLATGDKIAIGTTIFTFEC